MPKGNYKAIVITMVVITVVVITVVVMTVIVITGNRFNRVRLYTMREEASNVFLQITAKLRFNPNQGHTD